MYISQPVVSNLFYTGYLMKELKRADISLPEGDVNPIAPLPKHILSIMVSYSQNNVQIWFKWLTLDCSNRKLGCPRGFKDVAI